MNFFREIVVALPAELFLLQKHNNNKFEVSKIYMIASTLNIDFIQWHTHLIVCAVK